MERNTPKRKALPAGFWAQLSAEERVAAAAAAVDIVAVVLHTGHAHGKITAEEQKTALVAMDKSYQVVMGMFKSYRKT